MASLQPQRPCPALKFLVVASLARFCASFAPALVANRAAVSKPRTCGSPVCLKQGVGSYPRALRAAVPGGSNDGESDDIDQLVGIDEFRASKAERDREEADRVRPQEVTSAWGGGLGLEGAIFPSDVFPGSSATDDITLQGVQLEDGQPQAMVGFWKLYGSTADGEDLSGSIIFRADGQVVGGPTVRKTPEVQWSDPEGLQPVGGRWSVYSDKRTRRARLRFTIVLSFQKKQQLNLDGVVLMVGGATGVGAAAQGEQAASGPGGGEPQPQVFGGVRKRNGELVEAGEGDFSMMKVSAGDDKLVATVGSQQGRMW